MATGDSRDGCINPAAKYFDVNRGKDSGPTFFLREVTLGCGELQDESLIT